MRWKITEEHPDAEKLASELNITSVTAAVLLNRDISDKTKAAKFLDPRSDALMNTSDIADFEKGLDIAQKYIASGEKIYIYGDYDVDGVMSTTILYKALKQLTDNVYYYVPHRVYDGYGLNKNAVEKISTEGCRLLITCDNGIAALEEIALAKELGMAVIILDHHEPVTENETQILPDADAVIDCKRNDSRFGFREMCAGGLCYRFAAALYAKIQQKFTLNRELITFAGIATVCDIVSLRDDNRIMVKIALYLLNNDIKNLGLRYLISMAIQKEKEITPYTLEFIIGPCINAVGRLESAATAVELFVTDSEDTARALAARLVQKNKERKEITRTAAESLAKKVDLSLPVQVLYDPDIHESVAGIIAGRIKEHFYRPTLVITKGSEGCKGSGRSIEEYNLHSNLSKVPELFTKFGGHAMAVGFSLPEENIPKLRAMLNAACTLRPEELIPAIKIECCIRPDLLTLALAKDINKLQPFGNDNETPVFCTVGAQLFSVRLVGVDKNTVQFAFLNGEDIIKGIAFNSADMIKTLLKEQGRSALIPELESGNTVKVNIKTDIAYSIDINTYNGIDSIQLMIKDMR